MVESSLDLLDNMRKNNKIPIPDDIRIKSDSTAFDTTGAANLRVDYDIKGNIIEIKPNSMLLNYDRYRDFLFTIILKRDNQYGPIRIKAISSSNAVMFFEIIAKRHEEFMNMLFRDAVGYTIMDEKSGKMASFPVKLINEMIKNVQE